MGFESFSYELSGDSAPEADETVSIWTEAKVLAKLQEGKYIQGIYIKDDRFNISVTRLGELNDNILPHCPEGDLKDYLMKIKRFMYTDRYMQFMKCARDCLSPYTIQGLYDAYESRSLTRTDLMGHKAQAAMAIGHISALREDFPPSEMISNPYYGSLSEDDRKMLSSVFLGDLSRQSESRLVSVLYRIRDFDKSVLSD